MNLELYGDAAVNLPPNPFYFRVEPFLLPGGHVLDLGSGVGTGVRYLLDQGFAVDALDDHPEMVRRITDLCQGCPRFKMRKESFSSLGEGDYDALLAVFSLFFQPDDEFPRLWDAIGCNLKPGGIFGGQFLGPSDSWVKEGATCHSRQAVEKMLHAFKVILFDEAEVDGKTVYGHQKHWHVFHVIAQKI